MRWLVAVCPGSLLAAHGRPVQPAQTQCYLPKATGMESAMLTASTCGAGHDEALAQVMMALRDIQMRLHQLTRDQDGQTSRPSVLHA